MKTLLRNNRNHAMGSRLICSRARSAGLRPAAGSPMENVRMIRDNLFSGALPLTQQRSFKLQHCREMTLLEILVVCAVLAILAVILLPEMLRPQMNRARALRIQCVNNLKQ